MMELSLASDSHANPPYNTVFIDTSLDTHIAMIVSNVDTVADLKKKILLEHPLCFSSIGKIKIHALKVKRKGFFYHLSDSMFVRSAFDGVKRTWFLHVDASRSVEQSENQLACNPDSGNLLLCLPSADAVDLQPDEPSKKLSVLDESSLPQIKANQSANEKVLSADEFGSGDPIVERSKVLEMEVKHISDDHHKTSFVSNKKSDPEEKCNLYSGEIELPGRHTKQKKNDNKIDDMQYNGSLEGALKTEPIPKKRQKIKNKHKDALSDHALKEDNAPPFHASGKDTSQQENVILENPEGNAGVKVPNDMKMGNKQISADPGEKSSSEISKRSDYGVQKKHDSCEEIQVQGTHVECHDIKLKDTIDVQCNSSLGGIAQPKPAAKKKRKIVKNNESEGPVKENEALLCNFNKETSEAKIGSTANTLENEQKIINSNLEGLPTQPPEPNCLIRTSSSTGKRKRKKKSSNPCSQAVSEIPSEKDARQESSNATVEINHKDSGREFDTTIVPGESIQDATHSRPYALSLKEKYSGPVQAVEIPSLSPDIDMNEADASNMGRKSDVSKLGAAYEVKRTKISKKHHAVDGRDLSVKELDSLREDLELSEQENVVPGDHLKLGIDQTDKSEGEKEMSLNNDPNGMLSEKCRLSRCDGSEMNMKEVIASSKLLDASVGMEHQKPAVKRKKSKKAKNSVEGTPVRSDMEHAKDTLNGFASTEPHNAFNSNHPSNEADKGESILSQTERTEVLKTKVKNTSLLGVDREIDAMSGNEMESFHLTHISKTQVNTEDMADAKVRKKTKKQSSTAKNLSDLQKKELDVGPEVSTSSTHKIKVDVPSKIKRKTKSVKTSSTNQFKRSKLETEKDAGTEVESLHHKQDPGTFDSSQIPSSYALENNPVGRPLEANVDGNLLKLACINEANDHKEVSSCQSDMVNMPRQSLHKVVAPAQVLADEDTKVKRSERVSKTNKNKKISNVDSVATSHDLQNSLKTNKSQDVEKKSEGDNQLQDPLSVDGHNKLMPESDSKFSKVSRNDLKSPHDIGKFDTIPEEIRWSNVVNASGTSSTAHAFLKENGKASLSTSSSDSSEDRTYQNKRGKRQSNLDRYRVTVRKAPRKNPGEVVNSSHQRKSLLATYGSIFNDGGSESSEDHDGVENSDASTRTPSDSSASSDYTEGENNQHPDSSHGLYSAKRNESGAKSIGKSNSSGSKNVTMDVILRSSSRFKKAKLTASQSELNDTESQPVEFVPDSQANL